MRSKIQNMFLCVILDFDPLVIYGIIFQRHGIASVFQNYTGLLRIEYLLIWYKKNHRISIVGDNTE